MVEFCGSLGGEGRHPIEWIVHHERQSKAMGVSKFYARIQG